MWPLSLCPGFVDLVGRKVASEGDSFPTRRSSDLEDPVGAPRPEEATWEQEGVFRELYPDLFSSEELEIGRAHV